MIYNIIKWCNDAKINVVNIERYLVYIAFLQTVSLELVNCSNQETPLATDVKHSKLYDGKALVVQINTDSTIELYQHWVEQAYSGLFASIATIKMRDATPKAVKQLEKCSKNSYDVIQHANCLNNLINHLNNLENNVDDNKKKLKRLLKYRMKSKSTRVFVNQMNELPHLRIKQSKKKLLLNLTNSKENLSMEDKPIQKIKAQAKYGLLDSTNTSGLGLLGIVANLLTKVLMSSKNKTEIPEWYTTVNKLKTIMKKKKKKRTTASTEYNNDEVAFRGLKENNFENIDAVARNPKRYNKLMEALKRRNKNQKNTKDTVSKLFDMLRQSVKLGFALAGENTTDFDDKTMKLISPRFLSVAPEDFDNNTINLLSPSLLSMHNEGEGFEKNASMRTLMKDFNQRDQTKWMNFVMEVAGINDETKKLEKEETENKKKDQRLDINTWKKVRQQYDKEIVGANGQPLYFVKQNITDRYGDFETRKIETFERLVGSYTTKQWHKMNTTGYAVLNPIQLQLLYGADSPYNHSATLKRLLPLNASIINSGIEDNVKLTAQMDSFKVRQKDITLAPIVSSPIVLAGNILSQPIILSPLVLSPIILTPAVLGPIILSPWVFMPVIISPRVLSPLIVNPLIFSPIVLSPLILHPMILTPGVFNPIVLSPLVLSPFILAPQVFTPVVLSPFVLSPFILTPMVGSPLVLSPFVLSPIILSPQVLFAVVLSPYALSPLIESKLIASTLLLSPSWLS